MRSMFDVAFPPASSPPGPPGGWDVAAYYLQGPNASHGWSIAELSRVRAWVKWLLPIYVYDPQGRDGGASQAATRAILQVRVEGGPNNGVGIALDVEERDASHAHLSGFLNEWCAILRDHGYIPVIYTSESTAGDVAGFGAELWLAEWNNEPHEIPGAVAVQYKSPITDPTTSVDWNIIEDGFPLWPAQHGGGNPVPNPSPPPALNAPIVDMKKTPSGNGYWLLGADGGVFAFGDATYHGSGVDHPQGAEKYSALVPTNTGLGYWLAGTDGGVFTFGDAHFHGSAVKKPS